MAKSFGGINSNEGGVFSNYCKIDMRGQAKHGLWESSMTTGKYWARGRFLVHICAYLYVLTRWPNERTPQPPAGNAYLADMKPLIS